MLRRTCALACALAAPPAAPPAQAAPPKSVARPGDDPAVQAEQLRKQGEEAARAGARQLAAEKFRSAAERHFELADRPGDPELRADQITYALRLHVGANQQAPLAASELQAVVQRSRVARTAIVADGASPEALANIDRELQTLEQSLPPDPVGPGPVGPDPPPPPAERPRPPRGLQAGLGLSVAALGASAVLLGVGYARKGPAEDSLRTTYAQVLLDHPTDFPGGPSRSPCVDGLRNDPAYGLSAPCGAYYAARNVAYAGWALLGLSTASTIVFTTLLVRHHKHTLARRPSSAYALPVRGGLMFGSTWSF